MRQHFAPAHGRTHALILATLVGLLMIGPGAPGATVLPPAGETSIVVTAPEGQRQVGQATLVPLANGDQWVLWFQFQKLRGQRLDAAGEPVGEQKVFPVDSHAGRFMDAITLPTGGFLLADGLTLLRYDDSGVAVAERLAAPEDGAVADVALAVDPSGHLALAWIVDDRVVVRLFDADLAPATWMTEVGELSPEADGLVGVQAARLADGRTLVTWEEVDLAERAPWLHRGRVRGRTFGEDGSLGDAILELTGWRSMFWDRESGLGLHADLEAVAGNGFVLAWAEAPRTSEAPVVRGRWLDGTGIPMTAPFPVNRLPLKGAVEVEVESEEGGRFVILWTGYPQLGGAPTTARGTYHDVRGRLFLPLGQPVGGEFRVPPPAYPYATDGPDASFGVGGLKVLWRVKSPPRDLTEAYSLPHDTRLETWTLPLCDSAAPLPHTLCLQGGRFTVEVDAPTRSGPGPAPAGAAPLTSDTGTFWFFRPANVELMVKVLDGTPVNDSFWFFSGALSNVDYTMRVTDLWTSREAEWNSGGRLVSVSDTSTFPVPDRVDYEFPDGTSPNPAGGASTLAPSSTPSSAQRAPAAAEAEASGCLDPQILCFHDGRFHARLAWTDPRTGDSGAGFGGNLTDESGYFWFFRDTNAEVVLKVLDGTPVNGFHWVFLGGLTDLEFTLTVEDTLRGNTFTHVNPPYATESTAHTAALPGE